MRIAFIGAGAMAEAMISGLVRSGSIKAEAITASDVNPARLKALEELYGIKFTTDNRKAAKGKEIVVLAIKPQVLPAVTQELKGAFKPDQMVISIVAGANIETLRQQIDHNCIVLVMPNTPAQIGEGMSVWTATEAVSPRQREMTRSILAALGKEYYVADEKYLAMATAVSGSGPAYIFLFIEALIDAAVHIGMSRDMASELVLQTMLGSTHLAQISGKHVAELRNMVTSPGGTSTEGLLQLENGGLRAIITQAVIAAYEKAKNRSKEQK
ncbi:MAG: pyrroline-5-carboxylate reductase [Dehalococcoidia bacterium]|nr:pyrroline-5-carboxylate reductase [Dehalococcoidia bacterium]